MIKNVTVFTAVNHLAISIVTVLEAFGLPAATGPTFAGCTSAAKFGLSKGNLFWDTDVCFLARGFAQGTPADPGLV